MLIFHKILFSAVPTVQKMYIVCTYGISL